ncbi:MAG: hypothetical protein KAT66_01610 [Candidatus Lokiarchaeota archaeon]|jgi:hypothetical protein|nr:hypothetical protein [Candidatus Lokiarchaeota archaeon]
MKIPFKKIAKSITGVSTPIFGLSWNPPETDRQIARKFILFLEDRRVLFYPYHMEIPYHVNESILEIRKYLTEIIQKLSENSELNSNLKAMRAACRKYLDINPVTSKRYRRFGPEDITALGELRGVFGINLAEISVKYGIDIDNELGETLPIEDID